MNSSEAVPYGDAIAAKIRSLRAGRGLDQANLANRMSALGYAWHRQTVGQVERGKRRVTAEELLGLALCLSASLADLLAPIPGSAPIGLAGGLTLPAADVGQLAGLAAPSLWLRWDDDTPQLPPLEFMAAHGQDPDTLNEARDALSGYSAAYSLDLKPSEMVEHIIEHYREFAADESNDPDARSATEAVLKQLASPEGRALALREFQAHLYQDPKREEES